MFDEIGKEIDGVMISTPDHTHAIIAATVLTMNKHVYCQKPLTHSIYESRLLTRLAAKHKVATQMGKSGKFGRWSTSGMRMDMERRNRRSTRSACLDRPPDMASRVTAS
jgi:Predicted dehydrogenases and related proteins